MTHLSKLGAAGFALWGILHIIGGVVIWAQLLSGGAPAGYVIYGVAADSLPPATGAILGYFAYFLVVIGSGVTAIALRLNWRNSETGLAANTVLVALVEVGLIVFLLIPGHLSVLDAAPGFLFFAIAVLAGGLACRQGVSHAG